MEGLHSHYESLATQYELLIGLTGKPAQGLVELL